MMLTEPPLQIALENCVIRSLCASDASSLAEMANNRRIWRNLRDTFPHPYTLADAEQFIARMAEQTRETVFALEIDGKAVGTIGVRFNEGIGRLTGELGYWLGEPYWGRGVMTEAVRAIVEYAFTQFPLKRLEAWVYEWNPGSARVLEKAGFQREGIIRQSAIKDGQLIDRMLYACLADDV